MERAGSEERLGPSLTSKRHRDASSHVDDIVTRTGMVVDAVPNGRQPTPSVRHMSAKLLELKRLKNLFQPPGYKKKPLKPRRQRAKMFVLDEDLGLVSSEKLLMRMLRLALTAIDARQEITSTRAMLDLADSIEYAEFYRDTEDYHDHWDDPFISLPEERFFSTLQYHLERLGDPVERLNEPSDLLEEHTLLPSTLPIQHREEYITFLIAAHYEELMRRRGRAEWNRGHVEYAGDVGEVVRRTWEEGTHLVREHEEQERRREEEKVVRALAKEQAELRKDKDERLRREERRIQKKEKRARREAVERDGLEDGEIDSMPVSESASSDDDDDDDLPDFDFDSDMGLEEYAQRARAYRQQHRLPPHTLSELSMRILNAPDAFEDIANEVELERDQLSDIVDDTCASAASFAAQQTRSLPRSANDPGIILDDEGLPKWWTLSKIHSSLRNIGTGLDVDSRELAQLIGAKTSVAAEMRAMRVSFNELEKEKKVLEEELEMERREVEEMRAMVEVLSARVSSVIHGVNPPPPTTTTSSESSPPDVASVQLYIHEIVTAHLDPVSSYLGSLTDQVAMEANERKEAVFADVWEKLQSPLNVVEGVQRWVGLAESRRGLQIAKGRRR